MPELRAETVLGQNKKPLFGHWEARKPLSPLLQSLCQVNELIKPSWHLSFLIPTSSPAWWQGLLFLQNQPPRWSSSVTAGGPQLLWLCNFLQNTDPKRHRGIGGWLEQRPPTELSPWKCFQVCRVCKPFSKLPRVLSVSVAPLRGDSESLSLAYLFSTELGNKVTYLPGFPHRTSSQSRLEMKQLLAETRQGNRSHLFPVPPGQDFRPILAIISS